MLRIDQRAVTGIGHSGLLNPGRCGRQIVSRSWSIARVEIRIASVDLLGEAPVHNLHFPKSADHDVGGFQVAMDDLPGMGIRNRLSNLFIDRDQGSQITRLPVALTESLGQRVPIDQLHGKKRGSIFGCSQFVDRRDARVLDRTGKHRFPSQPRLRTRVIAIVPVKDLDRQWTLKSRIQDAPNATDSTSSDFVQDLITVRQSGANLSRWRGRKSNQFLQ